MNDFSEATSFRDFHDALRAQVEVLEMVRRHRDEMSSRWLADRLRAYGPGATAASVVAWQHVIEDTLNAPAVWVSPDMYDLTLAVMDDFDASEAFVPNDPDMFLTRGFVVLPHPFYATDFHGKRSAWRAMSWALMAPGVIVKSETHEQDFVYTFDLNADGIRDEPVIRMMLWGWWEDEDDYTELLYPNGTLAGAQAPPWTCMHASAVPVSQINRLYETGGEGDPAASWLTWWRVLNRVMGQRIITTERQRPIRPYRRAAERALLAEPSHVIVVALRRPRQTRDENGWETEETPSKGHVLSYRHIRVEHWRNQWYPSIGDHRQILIPQTIVGAEHLPLIVKRRVYKFDR